MIEHKSTGAYLQTLKRIYQERGLRVAIKHELIATAGSLFGRLTRANNYLVSVLDLAGDPISIRDVWDYNKQIKEGRLRNILNQNLGDTYWVPANWTEA